ncbi:hypothetical protein DFJ73DRAFT_859019 [Zopfochytrium polystomum]|nr:hypothetical protein DFJ73DRAFT_859019 [Zopfochytrium polystomum]
MGVCRRAAHLGEHATCGWFPQRDAGGHEGLRKRRSRDRGGRKLGPVGVGRGPAASPQGERDAGGATGERRQFHIPGPGRDGRESFADGGRVLRRVGRRFDRGRESKLGQPCRGELDGRNVVPKGRVLHDDGPGDHRAVPIRWKRPQGVPAAVAKPDRLCDGRGVGQAAGGGRAANVHAAGQRPRQHPGSQTPKLHRRFLRCRRVPIHGLYAVRRLCRRIQCVAVPHARGHARARLLPADVFLRRQHHAVGQPAKRHVHEGVEGPAGHRRGGSGGGGNRRALPRHVLRG